MTLVVRSAIITVTPYLPLQRDYQYLEPLGEIDGQDLGDEFGWSVAISEDGDTVSIGAHHHDAVGMPIAGRFATIDTTQRQRIGTITAAPLMAARSMTNLEFPCR